MILVRNVFQAKYGRGDELVAIMVEIGKQLEGEPSFPGWSRILTDLSGPFFTVVTEIEMESLGEWERSRADWFSRPEFQETFARTAELIESGRAELYTIQSRA